MKDDDMKNVIKLTAALALMAGAASAATSGTTVVAASNSFAVPAIVGYVSATVTATAAPVYIGLPSPAGTKAINSVLCTVRDTNFIAVPRRIQVSNTTDLLIESAGLGTVSGTLTVGDRVNCVVHFER